jgi:hypothetical protein
MSSMKMNSDKALRSGQTLVKRYGSWSAIMAAGKVRPDGVIVLSPKQSDARQAPHRKVTAKG